MMTKSCISTISHRSANSLPPVNRGIPTRGCGCSKMWGAKNFQSSTIPAVRKSPAEVESILVAHPQVSEAAAIGVPDSIKGEALVCFCILKKGANGDIALAAELKRDVGRDLGKALAPREVLFVADIPKTRNAKVMRRIVRAAYLGEKLGDTSALENLTSLDEIKRAAGQGA